MYNVITHSMHCEWTQSVYRYQQTYKYRVISINQLARSIHISGVNSSGQLGFSKSLIGT